MAVTARAALADTSPQGTSGWQWMGSRILVPAQTVTSAVIVLGDVIPPPDASLSGGISAPDVIASTTPMVRLTGVTVVTDTTLAAQAALTLWIGVYRAGSLLGGTGAFGWLYGGAGTPLLTGFTAVAAPALAGNTAIVTANGVSWLPLRAGDALVASTVSSGSTAIPNLVLQPNLV